MEERRGRRPGPAKLILAALIGLFGIAVFVVAVREGRADSALFFVALPTLLAAGLLLVTVESLHGRLFVFVTVLLLVVAVGMHEGAICVILAAPLVYAVAHGALGLFQLLGSLLNRRGTHRRGYALLPVPLLLLAGLEGVTPQWRIDPDRSVSVTRVVAADAAEVEARIAAGPRTAAVRSLPLRALGVPMPEHIAGQGLDPGDLWVFGYHGSSHGPGGELVTRVSAHEPGRLAFDIVRNDSITARWMRFEGAELSWHAVDATHTEVRIVLAYRRGLDPSWYFGPLQDGLTHAGAGHFLDMLALS
ncbi:hypothetical protein GCM10010399_52870 [Dactylosporangium fulvum]|uniref:Uncharacterized protein n=1 Tax=Dactylosporangium fulvum TaxID=53359 RepID=A0ABY5VPM3_9ACTN|nr:hypothetical protein [Dactylosporangium fulvum]UWP79054.1 hypothetical protein Dfulv_28235 [Dactylosporangium fulvum]